MKLRYSLLAMPLAAGLLMFGATGVVAQGLEMFAALFGGNEISPTGQANAGDPDGYGGAVVTFHTTSPLKVCVGIVVDRIDTPILAHIHQGIAGVNGPIVVGLAPPSAGNPGSSNICTAISATLLTQIRNNPSNFYVNVHTGKFPSGALRGQLF